MSKEIKFSEVLKKLEDNRFYHCSEDDDKSIWNRVSFDSRKTIDSPTLLEKVKEEEIDFLINLSLIDKKNLNATIIKGDNYEHNTDLPFIDFSKKWKDNSFDVNTGNLVGFIKQGPYIANISSRFGDEFLMYLIADADGFQEMEDFGSLSKNESELDNQWMLIYLWNIKLRKAYRLGVPKIYQSFKERLAVPRGTLDVIDYAINYKRGKYLCNYREHSYANIVNELIVATFKAIDRSTKKNFLKPPRSIYQSFLTATQGKIHPLQDLLATKPFTNPFFSDYNSVIELSKCILRNESATMSNDDSSAFLFDVSMLFEYFIRKMLAIQNDNYELAPKKEFSHGIPTGGILENGDYDKHDLQPDLVLKNGKDVFVFDVKYKYWSKKNGVKREDLFQLHTYVGQWYKKEEHVKACGFIYPIKESRWNELYETENNFLKQQITICGNEIPFYIIFFKVPEIKEEDRKNKVSFKNFTEAMGSSKNEFLSTITDIVLQKK